MEYKIIYTYDTERDEFEALNRGYRNEVFVQIKEKKYKLNFISMIRLSQEYKIEQEVSGYYIPDSDVIVVEDVTKQRIEQVVKKLYQENYFEYLDKKQVMFMIGRKFDGGDV